MSLCGHITQRYPPSSSRSSSTGSPADPIIMIMILAPSHTHTATSHSSTSITRTQQQKLNLAFLVKLQESYNILSFPLETWTFEPSTCVGCIVHHLPSVEMKMSKRIKATTIIVISLILWCCLVSIHLLASTDDTLNTLYSFTNRDRHDFEIIVLTMNRAYSLNRLLNSIENTVYGDDIVKLSIKIDASSDNMDVIACARNFSFSHGPVVIDVAKTNKGLRNSWLEAVSPNERGRVVIFEDDVDVSHEWYRWLKRAWKAYGNRTDLAGITLYRQTLIPKYPTKLVEIVNNHEPFLYSLVGSIGFSPHPKQWSRFLHWSRKIVDIETFDFSIPNIVYTYWWSAGKRRNMWTQNFIYFCIFNHLYTLHINLPNNKTMVSDMREKGVHFPSTFGRDFSLATAKDMNMVFPSRLQKYGFDGQRLKKNATSLSTLLRRRY